MSFYYNKDKSYRKLIIYKKMYILSCSKHSYHNIRLFILLPTIVCSKKSCINVTTNIIMSLNLFVFNCIK